MPKMTFIVRGGVRKEVDAPVGFTVLDIAHRHGVDIEGACEGQLACSTCHVIVEQEWYDLLNDASEDEEDMLDLAFGLTKTSRLGGCRINYHGPLGIPQSSHSLSGQTFTPKSAGAKIAL